MASIEKQVRKKGIVYHVTVYDGKKRHKQTFEPDPNWSESRTRKELSKFTYEFETKVKDGKLYEGDKLRFDFYCQNWLSEKRTQLSATTLEFYERVINTKFIPALGKYRLTEIKPKHIKDYILTTVGANGQKLSPSSIKKELAVLKSIFSTAWEDEIIDLNPAERVRPPKQEITTNLKYFTLEESQRFIDILDVPLRYDVKEHTRIVNETEYTVKQYQLNHAIATQFKLFFILCIISGARKGEILGLEWSSIDYDKSQIAIRKNVVLANNEIVIKEPKTKTSVRSIRLPDAVLSMLKDYREEWEKYRAILGSAWKGSDFIFIQNNGFVMHPSTPYHKFVEIIDNYNLHCENENEKLPRIPLHGLRHTSATLLISENVDVKTVSKRLGHSNTSTTLNIYTHSLEKQDEASAAKFEELFFPRKKE